MRMVDAKPGVDAALAEAILALQIRAYSVEAELIGDDRIPHLHENAQQLSAASLHWLIVQADNEDLLGAVAWTNVGDTVEIDRLVVEPTVHRRGIGEALVRAVLNSAPELPVIVATAQRNAPAAALYEKMGFRHTADEEVQPELWVSRYLRTFTLPN